MGVLGYCHDVASRSRSRASAIRTVILYIYIYIILSKRTNRYLNRPEAANPLDMRALAHGA